MYTLTILHNDGTTTTDRLKRINEGNGTALDKYADAVREWEAEQNDSNRAAFLMNSGTVIRRWELNNA